MSESRSEAQAESNGRPARFPLSALLPPLSLAICANMTEIETQILGTLLELERAVAGMATVQPKPNLLPLFSRLDELTGQLPPRSDPTLLHYLHKKSYEKARLFLQDRDAENQAGSCGHG